MMVENIPVKVKNKKLTSSTKKYQKE